MRQEGVKFKGNVNSRQYHLPSILDGMVIHANKGGQEKMAFSKKIEAKQVVHFPHLPHAQVVVAGGDLLGDDPVPEDALPLGHDDHVHGDVLREADGGAEVAGQGHQQVQDGHHVLGVDGLDRPVAVTCVEGWLTWPIQRFLRAHQ